MDKIAEKGNEYATKENTRLSGLSKSTSITKEKKSNFMLRANVLQGFVEGPEFVEEAKGAEKEEL